MTKEDVLRITLQKVKENLKNNEIKMDDLQEIIMNINDNDVNPEGLLHYVVKSLKTLGFNHPDSRRARGRRHPILRRHLRRHHDQAGRLALRPRI